MPSRSSRFTIPSFHNGGGSWGRNSRKFGRIDTDEVDHGQSSRSLCAGSPWWGPAAAIPKAKPTALTAAWPVGNSQVPDQAALATTGRSVPAPLFLGGERCCRCCWRCCPALLVSSYVRRLGTLAAAAASPQAKPPAGVVAAPGCPPTPARDRWPSGDLGGRPWLLSVC